MSSEIVTKRNLYKEFYPGQPLSFELKTLGSDGYVSTEQRNVVIDEIRGGGFFGKVLIPKDEPFVIKTSLPDPAHHLARTLYWGFREFPAQTNETDAKLEHLSARIIHKVLPVLTDGKYYAPNSLGYTKLSTGYAQVLERIDGRPPRFDLPEDEITSFKKAQEDLSKLAFELGLEQVGQVHPENPFGMANVWIDKKRNIFVWLDTAAAMEHKGPYKLFKFHKDIRNKFDEKKPTFNRIHTDRFLTTLRKNKYLFSYEEFKEIEGDALLYEKLYQEKSPSKLSADDFFDSSDELLDNFVKGLPNRIGKIAGSLLSPARIVFDENYRDTTTLSGVKRAREQGIISSEELKQAEKVIYEVEHNPIKKQTMLSLYLFYFFVGRSSDIITATIFANSLLSDGFLPGLIKAGLFDSLYAPLVRRFGTLAIARSHKTDLGVAATVASIPFIPGSAYSAVPAQIAVSSAKKSELIWHYRVREQIAKLSRIHPAGGYGSRIETELWNKMGRKLENLGKKRET